MGGGDGTNPSRFKGANLPVEQVSYDEALAFCRKVTEQERAAGRLPEGYEYTLPTEAQWEYACRAGTTGNYAGNLDAMAWYSGNSGSTTHAVGGKQANGWGLNDMHGNVWEWCLDWYGNYAGGRVTDPRGASSGSNRVGRGGGWNFSIMISSGETGRGMNSTATGIRGCPAPCRPMPRNNNAMPAPQVESRCALLVLGGTITDQNL